MPKRNRQGKASILELPQLLTLWDELIHPYCLITQFAYFTAARIDEACLLDGSDVVNGEIFYRGENTKTGEPRSVRIVEPLKKILGRYSIPTTGPIFPALRPTKDRWILVRKKVQGSMVTLRDDDGQPLRQFVPARQHISTRAVDQQVRKACTQLGYQGVSTHTFRRSYLTYLYRDVGMSLKEIQQISGHRTQAALEEYLDISREDANRKLTEHWAQLALEV